MSKMQTLRIVFNNKTACLLNQLVCTLALLLLMHNNAFCTEKVIMRDTNATTIPANRVIGTLVVPEFASQTPNVAYGRILSTVAFELNRDTLFPTTVANFQVTAKIALTVWYKGSNPNGAGTAIPQFDLIINYDSVKTKISDYRAFRTFGDVLKMSVTVVSVSSPQAVTPRFKIIQEIHYNQILPFTYSSTVTGLTGQNLSAANRIAFSWASGGIPADDYDLEWNFYEAESDLGKKIQLATATTAELRNAFRFDATRVTLSATTDTIPALYRNGYIIYRVRAARYLADGTREYAIWTNPLTIALTNAHENALNWQSDFTFAEEGKKVSMIKYFDGTLRERQAVTLSKANSTLIATQTIYDYNGRPSAKTMPLPTLTDTVKYIPTLAFVLNGATPEPFTKNNFDTLFSCAFQAPALMNDGRTFWSRYFSTNNPEKTTLKGAVIPDAEGFHYTMTEFTQDNTGRIKRQSGVGATFKMGSTKETQYFYGKPSQEELDRLFGTEVGYTSHYQKNMVKDPNGQFSVSYVDAHGRTIATALAGAKPTSLDTVSGFNTYKTGMTRNILNNVRRGDSLVSTYSLLVTTPGRVKVFYEVQPRIFNAGCEPAAICYDCQYDVRLQITDACSGASTQDPAFVKNKTTFTTGAVVFDTLCSVAAVGIKDSLDILNLPAGEYIVSKILKVHKVATDYYAENYLTQANCKPNLTTLKNKIRAGVNGSGCTVDCSTCATLTTEAAYVTQYITSITDPNYTLTAEDTITAKLSYQRAVDDCKSLCSSYSECEALYTVMIGDMSPGGQYALDSLSVADNITIVAKDLASIFSGNKYQTLIGGEIYRNELGTADTIIINGVKKIPTQLTINEFITYWKPSWAKALVNQHPEYCYYTNCTSTNVCNTFDSTLLEIDTYTGALAAGVVDTAGLIKNDPCFAVGGSGFTYKDSIFNWVYVNFIKDPATCTNFSAFNLAVNTAYNTGGQFGKGSTADNDQAWLLLRAFYLSYKYQMKTRWRTAACPSAICVGNTQGTCGTSIYRNKARRYIPIDSLNNAYTLAGLQAKYNADSLRIITDCDSTCNQLADAWIAKLAPCNMTPAQQTSLKTRLIEVCKKGCDRDHMYGSSTTKASMPTSFGDTSFVQALNAVIGVKTVCDTCHANLIDFPASFYTPVYIGPRSIKKKEDATCLYTNLTNLEACYIANPNGYTSFSNWLTQYSEYPLSTKEIDTLKVYFNPSNTSKHIPFEVNIPPYLECNTCKSCTEVQSLKTQFDVAACLPNTDVAYWQKFARFANSKIGFTLTAEDYYTFLNVTCPATVPAACTSQKILCPRGLTGYDAPDTTCVSALLDIADTQAQIAYDVQIDSLRDTFRTRYVNHCLQSLENLRLTDTIWEYHYTLYYYDQSGNLTQTIPPAGVNPLSNTALAAIQTARTTNTVSKPAHTLPSVYRYNSLNKVIAQKTPDADSSQFWYDRIGRLVVSQDGRQRPLNLYSYTQYDALGRVIEVGEINKTTAMTDLIARDSLGLVNWLNVTTKQFVTQTFYDSAKYYLAKPLGSVGQENLRNRVATTLIKKTYVSAVDTTLDFATHYSYDVVGNVKTLVQQIAELKAINHEYKRTDYDYDQLSGKVNAVFYQRDSTDQYSHRYDYDADNRLTTVYTSRQLSLYTRAKVQSIWWQVEATYDYFKHGPLARMELGERRVQGVDYAYTLQGWLKGVNSAYLSSSVDMGQDGLSTNALRKLVGLDQYGYILNYYQGDYKGAGTITFDPDVTATVANQSGFYKTSADLYNGNIRSMTVAIKQLTNPRAYKYKYDQLNRIVALDSTWAGSTLTALPNTWTKSLNHAERITYDPNGNIKTYQRYQQTAALMDNLTYNYYSGKNQLQRVNDAIAAATYTTDIDDQPTATNGGNNYIYDGVGNLVKDTSEALNVIWSPYGKVISAIRKRTVAPAVDIQTLYGYDPMQNRVLKTYINGTDTTKTYYLRDAQGNTLAVYTRRKDSLVLAEMHLFGSSRLGTWEPNQRLTPSVDTSKKWQLVDGQRRYELTNHLGNVLVTLNDRKQGFGFVGASGAYTFFEAVTIQATDYYPFGLEMPGRTFQAANTTAYRFGFNDKENDRNGSWSSTQLVQDYGERLYNPAIARFLSEDPKTVEYPEISPYQFADNMPIMSIDLDGLEAMPSTDQRKYVIKSVSKECLYCLIILNDEQLRQTYQLAAAHKYKLSDKTKQNFENSIKGAFGEGQLAERLIGAYLPFYRAITYYNFNQGSTSRMRHDIKVEIKPITRLIERARKGLDIPLGGGSKANFSYQVIGLKFNNADGSQKDRMISDKNLTNLYIQVKTIANNASAFNNIVKGYQDAIRTADALGKNNANISVLAVDANSYMGAITDPAQKGVLDEYYRQLTSRGGELFLVPRLEQNAREAMKRITDKVSKTVK